jgi:GTP-binding protein
VKSLPRVAIVGFPNVGKSTLFNRILGKKKALVHSLPGMTRDSLAAPRTIENRSFLLVDTGGLFGVQDEPLSERVRERAWEEARAADAILFVLDGKRDIAPAEEELYLSLKRTGRPVLVVVNKIDSPVQEETMTAEYYRLGEKNVLFVSAEHKLNIEALEEALVSVLPASAPAPQMGKPLRVAVVGRINVGKSSLVNRLAGGERILVSESPGTTRDSTDTVVLRNGKPFCLVDTAGIRRLAGTRDSREKAGIIRARANIGQADVVCLVLDAGEAPTRQDTRIARLAEQSGKPLVIALNKWDLAAGKAAGPDVFREAIFRKLGFVGYAPLLFVSARTGQRVVKILDTARRVHENASRHVETSRLNRFLARAAEAHAPRLRTGAQAKLRYMTQTGVLPPTFMLFVGGRGPLSPAYETHFLQALREAFGFEGTPLRLLVRAG